MKVSYIIKKLISLIIIIVIILTITVLANPNKEDYVAYLKDLKIEITDSAFEKLIPIREEKIEKIKGESYK